MSVPVSGRPVLSTMWAHDDPEWNRMVDVLPYRPLDLADVRRFWRECDRHEGVVLLGSVPARNRYRDLVLALSLKLRRRRPHVLISDATWEPRSRALEQRLPWLAPALPRIARGVIRLLDGAHVTYGVLSSGEVEVFAREWGVPADRVVFTSFCHTLMEGQDQVPVHDGDYLFAGGNSLRDYPALVAGLDRIGGRPTHLAAGWAPQDGVDRPWLQCGPVPHDRFVELMAGCRACVTPLAPSVRSAGQQTYLNAMLLRKPVIVTDAPGVRDFVEDGVTGLVVSHSPGAIGEAVAFVTDPANDAACAEMGERARAWVLANATPEQYRAHLVDVALQRA